MTGFLTEDNHVVWNRAMIMALSAENELDFIDGSTKVRRSLVLPMPPLLEMFGKNRKGSLPKVSQQ